MSEEEVRVVLTPAEAREFQVFREHREEFAVLVKSGVFDITSGQVILHKDSNGVIQQVDVNKTAYRYRPWKDKGRKKKEK